MFNGIIFNTGKVKKIKKNSKSVYVGIQTKIKFKKKDLGSSKIGRASCRERV